LKTLKYGEFKKDRGRGYIPDHQAAARFERYERLTLELLDQLAESVGNRRRNSSNK
jgi:hypothetical protein